ncbi:MAG: hypothetical protein WBL02_01035 [Methanomethylovorans sp.]|uniref:hypothetical protein n=1 Tax=Methanomethylovorans sp. TaxID=2758717 RepID=UPI000B21ED85|nr:hypothetical protein [Methanomethylovorans sp.]
MRLFKKVGTKRKLSDSEKAELEKRAYELGFEVGYHKHSELGWVSERYAALESVAKDAGLLEIVSDNYKKGKEAGARDRERNMLLDLSKKEKNQRKRTSDPLYNIVSEEKDRIHVRSGFRPFQDDTEQFYSMLRHPDITDLPSMTEITRAVERPQMIDGFRLLLPKNE